MKKRGEKRGKYKICYLINCLIHAGAQSVLINLLKNLDRDKFEPAVISLEKRAPLAARIKELGIPVYSAAAAGKYDIGAAYRLYKLLKGLQPDILHTHLFHADLTGRLLGKICRIPVIMNTIHNINLGSSFRDFLLRKTDFISDYTVVICRAAAERFVEKKIVSPQKLKVVYNGIDTADFNIPDRVEAREEICREFALKHDKKIAVSIGRLRPVKGYSYLLQALKLIKEELADWHFLIVGEGELYSRLQKECEDLALKSHVTFTGVRNDIPQLLAASEFLVLASLWEGLPVVIEEAMAAGLPVIATEVGGVPELVINRETGFITTPGDSRELAGVLREVLSLSGEKRREMGRKGRERVKKMFSSHKMTKNYEGVYLGFLEKDIYIK